MDFTSSSRYSSDLYTSTPFPSSPGSMSAEEMHQGPNSSLKPYDAPQLYANDWTPFYQGPISSAQSSQLWDVNGLENGEGVNGQQQHYSHRLQNLHPHSSHVSQYDASIHAMSYSTGRNRAEAHPALPTTHPFPSNQHNTTPGYGELEQYHPSYPYHQPHPSGTPYVLDAKNHSVVPHDSFNNVEQDNPPMPSTQPYHSKISSPLPHTSVRRCFNCQTTDPPSWRRSTLNPSEMLCNRCGLYERTHLRPHPIQFDTPRGGNRSRKHKPETPRTSFKELPGKAGKLPTEMVRHNPVPSNASSHMGNRSEQAHGADRRHTSAEIRLPPPPLTNIPSSYRQELQAEVDAAGFGISQGYMGSPGGMVYFQN